jgi:hypothetical protein
MPQIINNPFTMVLTGLWDCLLAHPSFVRDVADKNMIRFDSLTERDPLKGGTVLVADMPQVTITPESFQANLQETSSTTRISPLYNIGIVTGDLRYPYLGNVQWLVTIALLAWKTRIAELTWKGARFVKVVRLQAGGSGLTGSDAANTQNKNLFGWSSVMRVEVEMHFRTSDLLLEMPASDQSISN